MNTAFSLTKNGTADVQELAPVSLSKKGVSISEITLGLGWRIAESEKKGLFGRMKPRDDIDLDASVVTFDKQGKLLETVYFNHKSGHAGAIRHSGDNLTGSSGGAKDDEQIVVDLNKLPPNVAHVVCTVTSYRRQTLDCVKEAFVRVVNNADSTELCRYTLTQGPKTTGLIIAQFYRKDGVWQIAPIGKEADGHVVQELIKPIQDILRQQ